MVSAGFRFEFGRKCSLFVLAKTDQYTWPVNVEIPKSGGTWEKMSFEVTFKRLKQSVIQANIEDADSGDKDFCRLVVADWKGIKTEDGQDVPFSQDAFEELLDTPKVSGAIAKAFLESINGAPTKN